MAEEPEYLTPQQEEELDARIGELVARIEAATLEMKKRTFWMQMERLAREEIAMLEKWLRL